MQAFKRLGKIGEASQSDIVDTGGLGVEMNNTIVVTTFRTLRKWLTQSAMFALILFVYSGLTIGSQSLVRVVDAFESDCENLDSLESTRCRRVSSQARRCQMAPYDTIVKHQAKLEFRFSKRLWFACKQIAVCDNLGFIAAPRAPPALV